MKEYTEEELWDMWHKEWTNAYRFFKTEGNLTTKCRLKKKWYKEFIEMVKR